MTARSRSIAQWAGFGLLAGLAIYLVSEHAGHVLDFLPFALVLACPLMHLFMHHDHGEKPAGTVAGNLPGGTRRGP